MTPRRKTAPDPLPAAEAQLRGWLQSTGLCGQPALQGSAWQRWNATRTALGQQFWQQWTAWARQIHDAAALHGLLVDLTGRLQRLDLYAGARVAAELAVWPAFGLGHDVSVHAEAPADADPGGPWALQQVVQETGYDQVLLHLALVPRPAGEAGQPLVVAVEQALRRLSVVVPDQPAWRRQLVRWLQTPPTPVWLHLNLMDTLGDVVVAAFGRALTASTLDSWLLALPTGLRLWQQWLAEVQALDRQSAGMQRSRWLEPAAWQASWWVDVARLAPLLRSQCAREAPQDAALGVVRTAHLSAALRAAVEQVALSASDAPAAVVVHADAAAALPALPQVLDRVGLGLPKLRGAYWDPPYNTGSRSFAYRDARDPAVWHSQLQEVLEALTPLLAPDAWLATSMGQSGEPDLRSLIEAASGGWQRQMTVQVLVRHPGRLLVADRRLHEVTEALSWWHRRPDASLWRAPVEAAQDEHVWQLSASGPPQRTLWVGGKQIGLWPPEQMQVVRGKADPAALKRVLIRGALREANSSGRLYVALLEPLRSELPGWYAFVPDMGQDGQSGRWFVLPARADLRNGAYFQGLASRQRLEVVTDCWDLTEAYNRVDSEGGVRYRHGKKPLALLQRVLTLQGALAHPDGWWLDPMAGSGSLAEALWGLRTSSGGSQTALLIERGTAAEQVLAPRLLQRLGQSEQPFRVLWLRPARSAYAVASP